MVTLKLHTDFIKPVCIYLSFSLFSTVEFAAVSLPQQFVLLCSTANTPN